MARKNVVGISTNVTPKQADEINKISTKLDVSPSKLLRMALAVFVEANGGEWPSELIKHGGDRTANSNLPVDKCRT